jgi:PAS domain S-box-containing protein
LGHTSVVKKILRLLMFSLALASPCALAQSGAEPPRTIQVVVDGAYAPYSFQSDEGKLQGILIDQWQAWEKKTGIKVEIQALDWAEALRRMRAGEFDVIDSIVETAERRNEFDFTPPYATIEAAIFFRNDISGITDLASLKGFPVGVKAGDQHVDILEEHGVTVILFQSNDEIIDAAKQRKVNVFVADAPSAIYLLNKMGIEDDFRHSAPIFRDQLRRAVRKGDVDLLRTVSNGFASIGPDQLRQIDEKWFGRTIHRYGRSLTYAVYAAAVAILLIAGLAGWNRTLRREILLRTAALGESEQRFRQIAENTHEVFALMDLETRTFLYVSPAYEAISGRSRESLYRDPRSFLAAIHPEDRPRAQAIMKSDGEHGFEVEYRVVRPDGSIRWIWGRGFPVRDESGRFYRIAGIGEDITERKRAEENLKATTEQLRTLSARIQSAREEEGIRIARAIHDELGSALTSLRWDLEATAEILSASEKRSQIPDLKEKTAAMLELMDATINTVRRIASELRPDVLDLLGLAEAITWQAQQFQDRTGLVVHCHSTLEEVDLDQEQATAVFRIFQEALTNILRHARASTVYVTMAEEAGQFVLTVRDDGRGITENEKSGPLAIGLLGMRERAHLIGGEVDITGVSGQGTSVTVRLPIARPVPSHAAMD